MRRCGRRHAGGRKMVRLQRRRFSEPDDVRIIPNGRSSADIVALEGQDEVKRNWALGYLRLADGIWNDLYR